MRNGNSSCHSLILAHNFYVQEIKFPRPNYSSSDCESSSLQSSWMELTPNSLKFIQHRLFKISVQYQSVNVAERQKGNGSFRNSQTSTDIQGIRMYVRVMTHDHVLYFFGAG